MKTITLHHFLSMTLLLTVFIGMSNCGIVPEFSNIHYLGETHPSSSKDLEVFYDERDVSHKYRVIGTMTNNKNADYSMETVKESMLKKAQHIGADGLVFMPISVEANNGSDRIDVKAKAIRYLNRSRN